MSKIERRYTEVYERVRRIASFAFFVCGFILPWLLVACFSASGRYTSVLLAVLTGTLLLTLYACNPIHFGMENGKQRCVSKEKRWTAYAGVAIYIVIVVLILVYLLLPIARDASWVYSSASNPEPQRGKVHYSSTVFGLSPLLQSVRFRTVDGQNVKGYLFYWLGRRLRIGNTYEFLVTPTARLILEVTPVQSEKSSAITLTPQAEQLSGQAVVY